MDTTANPPPDATADPFLRGFRFIGEFQNRVRVNRQADDLRRRMRGYSDIGALRREANDLAAAMRTSFDEAFTLPADYARRVSRRLNEKE